MRTLKIIVMFVFFNNTQLSLAAPEQTLDLLMDCAVEMVEEQYDEGDSVEVGLQFLTFNSDHDLLNQELYMQCKERLSSYRSSKEPQGLDYRDLQSLARKDSQYARILALLPKGAAPKFKIASVKRQGLSIGLGLAVTCGIQKKILKTALGRRFETRRLLFPFHTGLGAGVYSYDDLRDVACGSYKSIIRNNYFFQKREKTVSRSPFAFNYLRTSYTSESSQASGYGVFYKERYEHLASPGWFMKKLDPNFEVLNQIIGKTRSRSSTATNTYNSSGQSSCFSEGSATL